MDTKRVKKIIQVGLLISLSLVLIACGGGGGGGTPSSSTTGTGATETKQSGATGGVTVTNTHSQPKELGVGDLMYVDFGRSSSLDFSGTAGNSEYIFLVSNTSTGSGNFSVQMSGDLTEAGFALAKALGADEDEEDLLEEGDSVDLTADFHDFLRQQEDVLEETGLPAESFSVSKGASAPSAAVSVGDKKTFKVLATLSSSGGFVEVTAVAEYVGAFAVFYVDERVTQDMLSDADVANLAEQFDATMGKETALFGGISDVNSDGVMNILFTPQVNRLGASGGGIITGFFSATDLYAPANSNSTSNGMEILYIMVPDPQGSHGVAISRNFALANLLPSVLIHELQHAISYNQHVFVKGGMAEQAWLNEGMSHLAEDLFGQGQENPSRYAIYLRSPHSYPLVAGGSPGLASRGAAYLFLRYLYEQGGSSSQFLTGLLQTSKTGVENVEKAFGGSDASFDQFGEFFLRWSVALAMSDSGLTQDSRYTYKQRSKNPETGKYQGVCLSCAADDGRGTILGGVAPKAYGGTQNATTAQSSTRFFTISGMKDKMTFSGMSGKAQGFGVLIRKK